MGEVPLSKRDQGRTTFGFLWRLGVVIAVLSAGGYALQSATDIRRKLEPMISDGIQAKTGRMVRSVKLKHSWTDDYIGTIEFMDGEVWDLDLTVFNRQEFSYRASPQLPAMEQSVRDLIAEMGFEPKVVTISKGRGGVFSGTAEAVTGEKFKVFEKTTVNCPKGEKVMLLTDFSTKVQIVVELVPSPQEIER